MKKLSMTLLALGVTFVLTACNEEPVAKGTASEDVRTIEVTTPPTSKNLSWQTPDGEILGYEPDVLRAIDEKLEGYEFNIQAVADSAQETGLKTGKYELNVGGFYPTPERKEQFYVPEEPTGRSLIKMYVREDSGIETLEDLVGKKITPFTAGGGTLQVVLDWQEENPEHKLELEESSGDIPYAQRLKEIDSGKYDAFVGPANLGQNEVIEELGLKVIGTDPIYVGETILLIHKSEENEQLVKEVNQALKELREEGKLSDISEEYYGEDVFQYEVTK
ncbi:transporter substrate-binding domain-containing protein [Virgibacillus halodenitrificans]|uniref:transporter substrate-binding domain-containing protein n=1 Tax=Virgibacillus halodenitrificans TaxID=1482 RepID=UPI00045D1A23|nr:transporter substrate-binding domain-containing protein [Virgibacillus halodenitrificans]MEC2159744.1 transporter substrate-binding domain-containing protein [Virgibacillus halodenitrificans]CDQ31387.1 Arginine-binding extracellular protein ArtP precursor [Virgibacillus halodenitrificans]